MKVGWVAPCHTGSDPSWPATLFCAAAQWIDFERLIVQYPAPGVLADRIRYHLEPGAVANLYVNDVVVPAVLNSSLQPWDRSPIAVTLQATPQFSGGTNGTLWTYTVPTGKYLVAAVGELAATRSAVATTASVVAMNMRRNLANFLNLESWTNVLGQRDSAVLAPGGLLFLPGEIIDCVYQDFSTGGAHHLNATLSGYTFNI